MPVEIEAKLKVDSLEPLRDRLGRLGAKAMAQVFQRDFYFDRGKSKLASSDCALRLRDHKQQGRDKIVLSFKGPKQAGKFKTREELQVKVDNLEITIELLDRIGYKKSLVIEKKREPWYYQECEVSLDELPVIGFFVEIEGPSETVIESVQRDLELENLKHIKKGYASLIREWCKKNRSQQKEFYF